jgi:hypothetical protein
LTLRAVSIRCARNSGLSLGRQSLSGQFSQQNWTKSKAMSDGIHTYTGPWINWSEGVIRGATLTLSQKHSGVLSAFLAILVYPMNGDYYGANGQMARYGPGCRHLAVSTVTISFAGTLFWGIQALSFIKPIPRNRQRARCTACPAPDHSPQQDRSRCSVGFDHAAIWEWVNSIASQGHWTVPTIGRYWPFSISFYSVCLVYLQVTSPRPLASPLSSSDQVVGVSHITPQIPSS